MNHLGNRQRQYFAFAFFAVTPLLIAVDLKVLPLSVAWIAAVVGFASL